jgi:hypothetical protein
MALFVILNITKDYYTYMTVCFFCSEMFNSTAILYTTYKLIINPTYSFVYPNIFFDNFLKVFANKKVHEQS